MKILITTDWYVPVINGVVTSVVQLEQELRKLGHEVRILTLSQSRHTYTVGNVTYIGSLSAGLVYPNARIKLPQSSRSVAELLAWHPDVIHSQCEFSTFLLAKQLAESLHIPIVHTYHTVYEDYTHYFSPVRKWGRQAVMRFSRWVANSCETVIAPTEKVRKLLNQYEISCPIRTIPSGIALDRFLEPAKRVQLDAIAEQDFVCLYVGRLAKEKRVDELIRLHAEMRESAVRLLLVGDGPYRKNLEALAQSYGIADRVVFTGMVEPQDVPAYYQCGNVFVSASTSETQGLTYIEALASGLPVICRKDSCLDGVVQNLENGLQYETGGEYISAIRFWEMHLEEIQRMKETARRSSQKFDSKGFGKSVEQVYETAICHYQNRVQKATYKKRFCRISQKQAQEG